MKKQISQVATADLTKARTVQQMAEAEGHWTADGYAVALGERIRTTCEPLDTQRERLAALCTVGAGLTGDQAAAAELGRHEILLTAIFQRFIRTAADLAEADPVRHSKAVGEYMHSALKAQRAAVLTLGALKTIRESQRAPDL